MIQFWLDYFPDLFNMENEIRKDIFMINNELKKRKFISEEKYNHFKNLKARAKKKLKSLLVSRTQMMVDNLNKKYPDVTEEKTNQNSLKDSFKRIINFLFL